MQKLSSILLIAGFLQRICADEWTTGENDDEAQSVSFYVLSVLLKFPRLCDIITAIFSRAVLSHHS